MKYAKLAFLVMVFFSGWTANGWRIGEDIAESKAQRVLDTIEIERLNAVTSDAVSARHAAEAAAHAVKTRTVVKEVIEYVQNPNSGNCALSGDWVRIHDDSARVPSNAEATSRITAGAGDPKSDIDALVTVTDNYSKCHANAERLRALQEWAQSASAQ